MTRRAAFADAIDEGGSREWCAWAAISQVRADAPSLTVLIEGTRPTWTDFYVAAHVVAEPRRVFVGAGDSVACYCWTDERWTRQWLRETTGFWSWREHDGLVLLRAELEFVAFSLAGEQAWTAYVEPPWDYKVLDGSVELDVMGEITTFPLRAGPPDPPPRRRT